MRTFNHQLEQTLISMMAIGLMTTITGCSGSGVGTSGDAGVQSYGMSNYNTNSYKLNEVVCEGEVPGSSRNGIKASLFYKEANMTPIYTVAEIQSKYKASTQILFFNDFNVPTRMFDQGFITPTGEVVKDDVGQKLIENFGLVFDTELKLSENDSEGIYEFALLADDGATLEIQMPDGQWKTLINNDGDHPTQMGCSFDTTLKKVELQKDENYPLRLKYYQGPRYHIANVLMWRKAQSTRDASCGVVGNETFFNPNNNSVPQSTYLGLINRGWTVVPAVNFYLPISLLAAEKRFNPCYTENAPVITGYRIEEVFPFQVIVRWETDRPATSLAIIKNAAGQTIKTTDSDNVLRKEHRIIVTGLSFSTAYKVQGVSYSHEMGMSMTEEIDFTTP